MDICIILLSNKKSYFAVLGILVTEDKSNTRSYLSCNKIIRLEWSD